MATRVLGERVIHSALLGQHSSSPKDFHITLFVVFNEFRNTCMAKTFSISMIWRMQMMPIKKVMFALQFAKELWEGREPTKEELGTSVIDLINKRKANG
jgi:hypothetical protein